MVRSRPALLEVASCAAGRLFGSRSLQVKKRLTCVALFGERSWAGGGELSGWPPRAGARTGPLPLSLCLEDPVGNLVRTTSM